MKRTQTLGLFTIGILMYPLFPGNGIQTLITKLFGIVFSTFFNSPLAIYILASTLGVLFALYVFNKVLKLLLIADFSETQNLKSWVQYGIFLHVVLFCIWFAIPFLESWLVGLSNNLNRSPSFKSISYLSTSAIQLLSFIGGLWLVYYKMNLSKDDTTNNA